MFLLDEDRQIDVTEIRIERPKYHQKEKYSGKKKYHTMKIQIIRGVKTGFIYEIEIDQEQNMIFIYGKERLKEHQKM